MIEEVTVREAEEEAQEDAATLTGPSMCCEPCLSGHCWRCEGDCICPHPPLTAATSLTEREG